MRILGIFPILAVAILAGGCALPRTFEPDVTTLEGGMSGVVERVSHVADPAGEGRVLVRLDNGFAVDACAGGESFEPGERVRIHKKRGSPRAARE